MRRETSRKIIYWRHKSKRFFYDVPTYFFTSTTKLGNDFHFRKPKQIRKKKDWRECLQKGKGKLFENFFISLFDMVYVLMIYDKVLSFYENEKMISFFMG